MTTSETDTSSTPNLPVEGAAMTDASSAPPDGGGEHLSGGGVTVPDRMGSAWDRLRHALDTYAGVGGVLVLLCVYLSFTQDIFFTWNNWLTILEANAVVLVVAVGLTFVLLNGGIDLSLGGLMAVTGVVLAELIGNGWSAWLAIVIVIAMAALCGLLNGVLIGKVGLSFLVVTLGTGQAFRGIAQVRTGGQTQSLFENDVIRRINEGELIGIPWLVWISLVVLGTGILVLRYTGFGRMVYACGGNREAARLAGINVTAVAVTVFVIAGLLAGLAGLMDTSRLLGASPTAATGVELTAAAAVLLGGTSFMGGRGTLLGTLLGVLFLGVLSNGITLAGISPFWYGIVSGVVLISAILLDRIRNGKAMA
ncbi:MAG: ABC transporter permease [Ilumatobacter sp.]|uniref:ABC transporter permease n=1 Tax=Ilumatobacter sp. TaxID=1967498 RepID=UPI00391D0A59